MGRREEKRETCPRCGEKTLHPTPARNALCRRDNETYICSTCGAKQAMADWLKAREWRLEL